MKILHTMSYVTLPSLFVNVSIISILNLFCTSLFLANSYKVNDIVEDEVSNPPVKKIAACATNASPSNSKR